MGVCSEGGCLVGEPPCSEGGSRQPLLPRWLLPQLIRILECILVLSVCSPGEGVSALAPFVLPFSSAAHIYCRAGGWPLTEKFSCLYGVLERVQISS